MRVRVLFGALEEVAPPNLPRQGSQRSEVMLEQRQWNAEA